MLGFPMRYRYVSSPSPSRCGCALNALSVKRSPEARNVLNDALRDIHVSCSVSEADKCRARRIAAPMGPAEVNTTALAAEGVLRTTCVTPLPHSQTKFIPGWNAVGRHFS